MVVQRRDGPRRLREIDDDDDVYVCCCSQPGAKNLDAMFGKARCLVLQQNFGLALDLMNQAVVQVANYLPAIIEKMKMQLAMNDWEQVVDSALRCAGISRDHFRFLFNWALLLELLHVWPGIRERMWSFSLQIATSEQPWLSEGSEDRLSLLLCPSNLQRTGGDQWGSHAQHS